MNLLATLFLGLAMSTDAFAAALGKGAGMLRPRFTEALRIGAIFGVVEAITPVVGWLLGSAAARFIREWDHWIAFGLLTALGLHMIWKSVWGAEEEHEEAVARKNGLLALALTGLATSIDAMAVGVGLAFADVNIAVVAMVIGLCTFTMVTIGIMAGHVLGTVIGKRAETAGGLVLIAVGAAIVFEHLHSAG